LGWPICRDDARVAEAVHLVLEARHGCLLVSGLGTRCRRRASCEGEAGDERERARPSIGGGGGGGSVVVVRGARGLRGDASVITCGCRARCATDWSSLSRYRPAHQTSPKSRRAAGWSSPVDNAAHPSICSLRCFEIHISCAARRLEAARLYLAGVAKWLRRLT
jgi:hypothetical protein